MKVVVAGASGFIGTVLVNLLKRKGHEIICLIRDDKKRPKLNYNVDFIIADITKREKLLKSMSGLRADALVHLAAINPLERDKVLQQRVNIDGMKNMIDAFKQNDIGLFVYAQGTGVYGDTEGEWIDENTPKNPDTGFAKRRHEAEEMLWQANRNEGLPVTVAVLGDVYGSNGWFEDIIVNKMKEGSFKIPGKGDYYRSFVHVEDAAEALALICEKSAKNTTYLIADDEPARFDEFIYYVAERMGVKKPGKVPAFLAKAVVGSDMVELLTYSTRVKNTKAKQELGWQLQFPNYREGISDVVDKM